MANFDYEGGYESDDYYYISLNPCKGKINDNGTLKSIVNIIIPKSEFTTVDLTKYVPTGVDGYTFTGWYIGKSGEGFGYEYKEEITKTDFKEKLFVCIWSISFKFGLKMLIVVIALILMQMVEQ